MYYVLRTYNVFKDDSRYFARDSFSYDGIEGLAESRDEADTFNSPREALTAIQRFYVEKQSTTHIANFDLVKVKTEVVEEVVE